MHCNLSSSFKKYFLALVLILAGFGVQASHFAVIDSVGVQTVNGKTFILHKVEAGQTLYAISRKYKVEVDALYAANPEARRGLDIGQVLKVPVPALQTAPQGASVHIVESSQTLFSISRQYNVSVSDIKKWNKLTSNALSIGQRLNIYPSETNEQISEATAERSLVDDTEYDNRKIHTVAPSQTLYSISRIYKVDVNDIKKWNKLSSNEISIGQKLIVSFPKENLSVTASTESDSHTYSTEVDDVVNRNEDRKKDLGFSPEEKETEEDVKLDLPKKEKEADLDTLHIKPRKNRKTRHGIDKIMEYGLAEVIDENVNTKKYLALHRTAPIGTVMRVRNELNNRTIFVRVLGRLPDTGDNEKLVIKISRAAFEKLGGINRRFPVEMSYVP